MPGFPLHNVIFYSNYTRIYTEKNKKYISSLSSWFVYAISYPEITEVWIAKTPKVAANLGDKFEPNNFRSTVANKSEL